WTVVVIVSSNGRPPPATRAICDARPGGAGLLCMASNAAIRHIYLSATQLFTSEGLQRLGRGNIFQLHEWHNDQCRSRKRQGNHSSSNQLGFIFHNPAPKRVVVLEPAKAG